MWMAWAFMSGVLDGAIPCMQILISKKFSLTESHIYLLLLLLFFAFI